MTMTENIDTCCPHERDRNLRGRHADHKPLTFAELGRLLRAATVADGKQRASIQVRLIQAIPGMTCPRPIQGAVAAKMAKLERLYVEGKPEGLPRKAAEFWAIIKG